MKTELAKKIEKQSRRPSTPGEILEDLLDCSGISQSELARCLNVSGATINRLINGHQTLSTDMAQRLGRFWGDGARVWLTHQQMVDQWELSHTDTESYKFITPQRERVAV